MKRLALLAGLLLSACAPTLQQAPASLALQAAFSSDGVVWSEGGQAHVARAPTFQASTVRLPAPATAVSWQGGVPWVAVPRLNALLSADGRPVTLPVGRVVALSGTRVYRQDGSAVTYAGAATEGLIGAPGAVLTGPDGLDYAVQQGRLYRVSGGPVLLSAAARPFLYATLTGAATANAPTLQTQDGLYTLSGEALERRDLTGALLARVSHAPGLIGAVGATIVTVSAGGLLRFFAPDLRELKP
ncbi:hypothetical protein [Deinococcus sonorensis]|uniref:Lipoprotein n=2 Tax=Deinococcus sonorensis TaxID=309891 RepID=A0AAU7UBE7_9DEIO